MPDDVESAFEGSTGIGEVKVHRRDITAGHLEHVHTDVMDTVFVRLASRGTGRPTRAVQGEALIDFADDGTVMGVMATTMPGMPQAVRELEHIPSIRPVQKMDAQPWSLWRGWCSCGEYDSQGIQSPSRAYKSAEAHAQAKRGSQDE